MQDNSKFDPNKLQIIDIKFVKGELEVPEIFDESLIDSIESESTLAMAFNSEVNQAKIDLNTTLVTKSNQIVEKEATGHFHFIYIIKVENLGELSQLNPDDTIALDALLANSLASICYSTTRGILLTRLQGSAFQRFILPIVNTKNLIGLKVEETLN